MNCRKGIMTLAALAFLLVLNACADLVVKDFSLTDKTDKSFLSNEDISDKINLTVHNAGSRDAGKFLVGFYTSRDSEVTRADTLLHGGRTRVDSAPVGETVSVLPNPLERMLIPVQPYGNVCLGVFLDDLEWVNESLEDNNTACIWVFIEPEPPR